jgi:O-antigen biosynthesis protein WbqP
MKLFVVVLLRISLLLRVFDFLFSLIGMIFGFPILVVIFLIGLFDTGSPLFIQKRIGRDRRAFKLVKFRTMSRDTASMATHLVSQSSVTRFGKFLRKTKLDELPQLWNVLKGDMSLVGPRPNLESQVNLIMERSKRNIYSVRPGITGLAQILGVDMSRPELLAETDERMISEMSFQNYLKFIILTLVGRGAGDRVRN